MANLLRSDVGANEAKSAWVSRQRRPGDPAVAAAIAVVRFDALRPDGLPLHFHNQSTFKERSYLDKRDENLLHEETPVFDHALTPPRKTRGPLNGPRVSTSRKS
jgi:hypothetical protein